MKKGVIALLACMFALSLALVGCGGGGDVKSAWVGTWDLIEMEESGHVTTSDDLQMLKDLGITVSLDLKDDGTGALVMFGEKQDAEWEAKSATEGTFTVEGSTVDMKIADGKLTIDQNGGRLVFEKGEASSSSAASDSAASGSASSSS